MKIFTLKSAACFPFPVPHIQSWDFVEEHPTTLIVKLYGGRKTILKKNVLWFWDKERAIEKRKELIAKQVQEAKSKLERLTNEYEKVEYIDEQRGEALPDNEQLRLGD